MIVSRRASKFFLFLVLLVSALSAQTARLINISTRGQVGTDANILVGGFVISGSGNKTVLIRAIGPGLGAFGVAGTLPDPVLSIFNSGGTDERQKNEAEDGYSGDSGFENFRRSFHVRPDSRRQY